MDDIKISENKIDAKKSVEENFSEINTDSFDKTLKLIEKTMQNLGENIEPKKNLPKHENIEDTNIVKNKEHEIDSTHLKMDDLHDFSLENKLKNKNSFGFYTYLALTIGIIFAIYELLNISKNLIILKYPITEPYIEYFYEVIEILAYLVMNTISFLRDLF
jgi:hypothetical protein